jgi:hypothetical protein
MDLFRLGRDVDMEDRSDSDLVAVAGPVERHLNLASRRSTLRT